MLAISRQCEESKECSNKHVLGKTSAKVCSPAVMLYKVSKEGRRMLSLNVYTEPLIVTCVTSIHLLKST